MKPLLKVVTGAVVAALLVAVAPTKAQAGPRDGETAAAIIAGVATVGIIAALASHDQDVRITVHAGYQAPTPRWTPAPAPPRVWVPGHYELRREAVRIPGRWETETLSAEYGWVQRGWHRMRVVIRPACTRRVWIPERTVWRETRVWVPGHPEPAPRFAGRADGRHDGADRWGRH